MTNKLFIFALFITVFGPLFAFGYDLEKVTITDFLDEDQSVTETVNIEILNNSKEI